MDILVCRSRGMSYREIEDLMNTPRTTVSRIINRAKVRLRRVGMDASALDGPKTQVEKTATP